MSDAGRRFPRQPPSLETTVTLLALAFFIAVLFQTVQLVRERFNLSDVLVRQEAPIEEMLKLRDQVNALAGDTAALAQSGDAAAKQVVSDLAALRIAIHPPNTQPAPADSK